MRYIDAFNHFFPKRIYELMLQSPAGVSTMLLAKGLTLVACWLLARTPGLLTLVLWKSSGDVLYGPEVLNLLLGHPLRVNSQRLGWQ